WGGAAGGCLFFRLHPIRIDKAAGRGKRKTPAGGAGGPAPRPWPRPAGRGGGGGGPRGQRGGIARRGGTPPNRPPPPPPPPPPPHTPRTPSRTRGAATPGPGPQAAEAFRTGLLPDFAIDLVELVLAGGEGPEQGGVELAGGALDNEVGGVGVRQRRLVLP